MTNHDENYEINSGKTTTLIHQENMLTATKISVTTTITTNAKQQL